MDFHLITLRTKCMLHFICTLRYSGFKQEMCSLLKTLKLTRDSGRIAVTMEKTNSKQCAPNLRTIQAFQCILTTMATAVHVNATSGNLKAC